MFDDLCCDTIKVFTGSLAECLAYAGGKKEFFIELPDGITVYKG